MARIERAIGKGVKLFFSYALLLAKGFFYLTGDIRHAANAFDAVVLGGALWVLRGPLLVIIDQRCRLIVINRQAITHRGLLIVLTLDKRFASDVIFTRFFGRIVINVIDAT